MGFDQAGHRRTSVVPFIAEQCKNQDFMFGVFFPLAII